MGTKTTITSTLIAQAGDLASAGYNNTHIAQTLDVSTSTLRNNKSLKSVLLASRATLKDKVSKAVIKSIEDGETITVLSLAKRYSLFSSDYTLSRPKTTKQALAQITKINQDTASGEIPIELAQFLIKNTLSFIKALETIDHNERLERIERFIKERENEH